MIDLIHIHKSYKLFEKSNYTTKERKAFHNRHEGLKISFEDWGSKTLYLPIAFEDSIQLDKTGLLIFIDHEVFDLEQEQLDWPFNHEGHTLGYIDNHKKEIIALHQLSRRQTFDIFKIKKNEKGSYELSINYTKNSSLIGEPKRDDHKIIDLKIDKPIRYKINGKTDFTLSGTKERTYREFDYIIEFTGMMENIEFSKFHEATTIKTFSTDPLKTIDERKILY